MTRKSRWFIVLSAFFLLILSFAAGEFRKNARVVVSNRASKGLPDIAYNAQAERYLVVWQERSGGIDEDWDIRARVLNRDGSPASGVLALASSAENERLPKTAATGSASWTVVWSTGRSIESCAVDAAGKADDFRTVTTGSARPVDRPDIGASSMEGSFLVVWEELDELGLSVIKGRRLQTSAGRESGELILGHSPEFSLHNPSINQAGGRFFVVWEKHVDARRTDIEGRNVAGNVTSVEGLGDVVTLASDGVRNSLPSVTALTGTDAYLVVWQKQAGNGDSDIAFADIVGKGVRASGKITNSASIRESRPFASSAGIAGRVLVTYQSAPADNPLRREITARTIGFGDLSASMEIALDVERTGGGNPAAVPVAGADGRGLAVWDANEGQGTTLYSKEWLAAELPGEPPSVKIISPLGGQEVSKAVQVQVSVDAGGAISRVEFLIDGTMAFQDSAAPYSWIWDTKRFGNGVHSVAAVAHDEFGQTDRDEVSVTVANSIVALDDVTISGTVTIGGVGHNGVLLAGLSGNPRTDATGAYSALVPMGWSGTVTPTLPGFTFNPPSRTYSDLGADATSENYASTFVGGVDDAYEDNDNFASAAVIPIGTTQDLVLRDEEWYKFYVPAEDAGKDLKVRVWATSFPDGTSYTNPAESKDLDFAILNAAGKLLTYNVSGSADETAYVCDAPEGWYTIAQEFVGIDGTVYAVTVELSDAFGLSYITGRVTADGGAGIEGAIVELYGEPLEWSIPHPMVATDADGNYKIGWLPGDYAVRFNLYDFNDTLDWTPDVNYQGEIYHYNEIVTLAPGSTVTGIDGELTPGGVISGRITDASGNPINMAVSAVYTPAGTASAGSVYTDMNGNYAIDRLRTANYALRLRSPGSYPVAVEWYDDRNTFADAIPVPVVAGETTAGIDAVLDTPHGRIGGLVTDAEGNPIAGVQVIVSDVSGITLQTGSTSAAGNYLVGRLPTGSLKVYFNAVTATDANFVSEYYPDKRFIAEAVPVEVVAGQTTMGINAQLAAAGTITGRVTRGGGGGFSGISVQAFDTDSDFSLWVTTDVNGDYIIRNLPPDDYKVRFRPSSGTLAVQWWNDKASFTEADLVTVAAGGTVTGINAELTGEGGVITGQVTDEFGAPIAGLTVVAQDAAKLAAYSSAVTGQDGNYSIARIPTCQAKVWFNADDAFLDYVSEFYNNQAAHGSATPVDVTMGETTAGINAMLATRPVLTVETASLMAGELAVPYSASLAASGGRTLYHWTVSSGALPDGLTMNGRGEISGTPTMAGTFVFTVRVTDSTLPQRQTTRELSISMGAYTGLGYTISGKVLSGGIPLAGVQMSGFPGSPLTNSSGGYVAVVQAGWFGTATPILAAHFFSPQTRTYADVSASYAGQDYSASMGHTISGTITNNGMGLAGVVLSGLPGDPVTDATGFYFGGVPVDWTGTVKPTLAGFVFTPANRAYSNITADVVTQDYTAVEFVLKEDLLATWDGQGVYYRNSDTGAWVKMASPATMIACGDLDGDGIEDIIGLWPTQGGIWVKYSQSGAWAQISSTAVHIASGDMNGDGREDLLGTWNGQGVFYRNSLTGAWVKLASPATMITTGDLDGDGKDDLIGIWPAQGGVWAKYSKTGAWAKLAATARDISAGDANGDGRDDLIATWDGQGVFYRNSRTGGWVKMASEATQVTCGDVDADGKSDLLGIWPTQGGVWVKYSRTNAWAQVGSTARDISAGFMRLQGSMAVSAREELAIPAGGLMAGPEGAVDRRDFTDEGPGGRSFRPENGRNLTPGGGMVGKRGESTPGPGERGFRSTKQKNLIPTAAKRRPHL